MVLVPSSIRNYVYLDCVYLLFIKEELRSASLDPQTPFLFHQMSHNIKNILFYENNTKIELREKARKNRRFVLKGKG